MSAKTTQIARRDWRDLVRHGYASIGPDGIARALTYDPTTGATALVPITIVPDKVIYREG